MAHKGIKHLDGGAIDELREKRNCTVPELAKLAGMSAKNLDRIIRGQGCFDASRMRIAKVLCVEPSLLLRKDVSQTQAAQLPSGAEAKGITRSGRSDLSADLVLGSRVIYARKAELWQQVEHHVVSVVVSAGPKAPEEMAKVIARRLAQRRQDGQSIRYDVFLILDGKKVNRRKIKEANDKRLQIYQDQGVDEDICVSIVESSQPWLTFDVMIADEQHVMLGFPQFDRGRPLEVALEFHNAPALATYLRRWCDQQVAQEAIPYRKWAAGATHNGGRRR